MIGFGPSVGCHCAQDGREFVSLIVDQAFQARGQPIDFGEVKSGRRLVENEKKAPEIQDIVHSRRESINSPMRHGTVRPANFLAL